jgi:hypothetical protein
MARRRLSQCFEVYGAVPANPRWSWSARSAENSLVVLTLWKHQIRREGRKVLYRGGPGRLVLGNRERVADLKWARDNCSGRFRVVIIVAKDSKAESLEIADCYPEPKLVMD